MSAVWQPRPRTGKSSWTDSMTKVNETAVTAMAAAERVQRSSPMG